MPSGQLQWSQLLCVKFKKDPRDLISCDAQVKKLDLLGSVNNSLGGIYSSLSFEIRKTLSNCPHPLFGPFQDLEM